MGAEEPGLFIIESGKLGVYKNGEKIPFTYDTPGQYFGDLALLYNAPRAATVVAETECSLWSIDRNTFNVLVKDASRKAMEKRMNFLKRVPILKGLTSDELSSLCDAMQTRMMPANEFVIKQGEKGSEFFIVERGHCEARKDGTAVMSYDAKSYFGELALINDDPRAADVVTTQASKLLVLGVGSFKRLLGPLDQLLRQRANAYAGVSFGQESQDAQGSSLNANTKQLADYLEAADSDDNEDDMDEEEFEKLVNARMDTRKSMARAQGAISAETFAVDANWKPPVHPKTADQETRLKTALSRSFMFAALAPDDLATVVSSFQEFKAPVGTTVITQGAMVDAIEPGLFVIESGKLNVFKDGGETPVFTYTEPGQYFGDLALLYNAPRAATVTAETDSLLWSIDRTTFSQLVLDASRKATAKRKSFLENVECFKGLTPDEMMNLCENLLPRVVEPGTAIIKADEEGLEFFIVEEGKCEARKEGAAVMDYGPGSYFGELALIRNDPRAADVVALTQTRLLVLGAASFKRILGPLDDLMRERADKYNAVSVPS